MSAELSVLYEIQQLDTEIARLRRVLAGLDAGAATEQDIILLKGELAALRQRQDAAEKENVDLELGLRSLQDKRKRFSDQLYSGKVANPRQLADLQGEVEMLGREVRRVEDRMLELMDMMESQRIEIASREERLKGLELQLAGVRSSYEETGSRLKAQLSQLEASRDETAKRISPALLKRYEQIRSRSGNLGLVKVTANQCPGCHISLPSETLKGVKAGRSGLTCESCGRMLYWVDEAKRPDVEDAES